MSHDHHECHSGACSHERPAHYAQSTCNCCCHKQEKDDGCCHFSDQLLELADDAWMELLKEKIKTQIEKVSGKHLDDLAKLVNEANHERWHEIFADRRHNDDYKEKLREYFHQSQKKR